MKSISLTHGYVALIDDEDFEKVSKFKWFAVVDKKNVYARRTVRTGERKQDRKIIIHMHRFILGLPPGSKPMVDHENGIGLDNQKLNLRIATAKQNNGNSRKHSGTSKFKGVHWNKTHNKWHAQISNNNIKKHIGLFTSETEAANAYDLAAKDYFGDFALTNEKLGLL
jgi:AP2 domain